LYEAEIDTLTLIPSTGGRFEVTVDTQLVFSKIRSERNRTRMRWKDWWVQL
jgi:predicted Rdx family selenoprotein